METARALAALDGVAEPIALVRAPAQADRAGPPGQLGIEHVNAAAAALAGRPADQLRGLPLEAVMPCTGPLLEDLAALATGGEPLRASVPGDDGRPVRVAASRLGERLLVVLEDATALRARDVEAHFGAVLEATSDWVSIADRDGNMLYINPAGRRMVGLDPDESIAGRRIGAFSPAWAREHVRHVALPAARRHGVWRGDLARLHRDGHEIPISQVIVAGRGPDGEVDFYATIARDMTRERAAEEALRESEERFRVAFESAPVGVVLTDLEGRFVQVNDAYCRLVRRPREELMRGGPVDITHPDDAAHTRHAIALLATGEASSSRLEKRYVDPHGEEIWVEVSASAFGDAGGRPRYLIAMVQDLGERRVAQALQRSMLTRLPRIDGIELAERYLPGTRDTVGGDWYDVIPLPDGRAGIAIGDVVGRGIEAAATMSQLRTALRAYAVEGNEPAAVVAKLHRLVDHLRIGMSTTLVYADLDPFTRELRWVSAGHLPLLHVPADGAPRLLAGSRSGPLGTADPRGRLPQERIVLAARDTLLLYTDGLVERREVGIDRRLRDLCAAVAGAPADLRRALGHVTEVLVGGELRRDDVALLALRAVERPVAPLFASIAPTARQLGELRGELRAWLAAAGLDARAAGDVLLAVGEACANAIEHAGAPPDSPVDVRAQLAGGELVVEIRDHGSWRAPAPRSGRGHGLRIMRSVTDALDVGSARDGTRVWLRSRVRSQPPPQSAGDPAPVAAGRAGATLTLGRERDVVVARLAGEIDLAGVADLGDALLAATARGDRGLVVDLDAVDYLDSAGLHMLHDAARKLGARGQSLQLAASRHAPVQRLLDVAGLGDRTPLHASVAAAVEALATPPLA